MKTLQIFFKAGIFTVILFLLNGKIVNAQEKIDVTNTQALMSKGPQTCYVVTIPQADLDIIQKNWTKKLQEGIKNKVKEENHELVLKKVIKSELGPDTMNIYSLLIQREESRVIMNVFFEIGGVFFGPKEDKTDLVNDKTDNNIRNYLRTFAVEQYKLAVSNELEGEQKKLETMQDDLEELVNAEESMTKDITSMENDIDKTERRIKDLEASIDLKNQEILAHKTSMMSITSETEKKAAEDKQKSLEKEKNKLEKERSSAKDDISSYKSKIEKNKKNIEEGKKLQEEKSEEITKQKEVIKQVQAKLEGIK